MDTTNRVIAAWIDEVTRCNVIPETCAALLVGLFPSEDTYQAYLIGSNVYDAADDDWACNQDFLPEPRYLNLGIPTSELWETCHDSVAAAVRAILAGRSETILHKAPHVSVGFDDGDLEHIK